MNQPVAIVQDLTDLSVRLVGPGARAMLQEIEPMVRFCAWLYRYNGRCKSYPEALRRAWRTMKLLTQPV